MLEADESIDVRRSEVIMNRAKGLNDDGSMTANLNGYGEIDYGRDDGTVNKGRR